MKRLVFLLVGFIAVYSFSSCLKGDTYDPVAQLEIEKELIKEYIDKHFPGASAHQESGIYFQLLTPGDPEAYEYKIVNERLEYPTVRVKYTGKLLDGTVFDKQDKDEGVKFSLLGNIIQAWPIAFFPQKIDEHEVGGILPNGLLPGAKIRFVTPSIYAYRNQQSGSIPANSPLDFTIEVLDVEAPSGTPSN